ncbi:hypothetical protein BofuT4_uP120450.1 [Botrytis cinerea T4]|uniref:Uncharacterized protein n=1 Tax=Botryotinia fuckeliana (strain T4) TaxID=999810 RepID=G2XY02_BOTF4|nr:hypothetical protein BofuT4_uP120450.1 [Botrytis cinerea T4]
MKSSVCSHHQPSARRLLDAEDFLLAKRLWASKPEFQQTLEWAWRDRLKSVVK